MDSLDRLFATIDARRDADPEQSWTARMLARGPAKCAEKFGEEAVEAIIEAARGDRDALIRESADVLYHFCIMLASQDIGPADLAAELSRREERSGLAERASRSD